MSSETPENLLHRLLSLSENKQITREAFIALSDSLDIPGDELCIIFNALDLNGDGVISQDELRHSFADLRLQERQDEVHIPQGMTDTQHRLNLTRKRRSSVATLMMGLDFSSLSSTRQEQVVELYQRLHTGENPELLDNFESILLGVIKDVRSYQQENERLEKTFKREKEQHDKHLRQLEEEMEGQMQKVEERVRKQEKERLEQEKSELRAQLDSEINSLQQNLKRLQQEGVNKFDQEQERQVLNIRKRLEDIQSENRTLKSELTDSQTNLALVRSELTSFRQQFHEKVHELNLEKETIMDYVREQDNLTRQLHMLHEANKKLHDINDDLRMAVESSRLTPRVHRRSLSNDSAGSGRSTSPRLPLQPPVSRMSSTHSDLDTPGSRPASAGGGGNSSLFEELSLTKSPVTMTAPRISGGTSFDEESVVEDIDSGHSTLRDVNDVDTEVDSVSMDGDARRSVRRHRRSQGRVSEEDEPDSHDEMDTDIDFRFRRPSSVGSRGSSRSLNRDDSVVSHGSRGSSRSRRQLPLAPIEAGIPTIVKVTKEPERMYKVVLAGDAAVGKSSFIVRLCKGKFVPNLSSTLGVDFQNKVLEVDSHTVALQLWDTAGQERFRSIAKSYFRRADGVLLLYDCTYERSFLNVREWMEAIEDSSPKKIPIMLVGNKTDQRPDMIQQGRRVVRYEDGQRLSREIDALFIETSAKDGQNVQEAVIELTRLLRTNEDMEVKTVGMQLQELRNEKKSSCCGGNKR